MNTSGIQSIDHSIHLTHEWLNELMERLDWDDKHRSYRLLRATLHALRDWLSINESAHLSAQLPIVLRGVYYEGWRPSETPVSERGKDDFIARIEREFQKDPIDNPDDAVRAVFAVMKHKISEGEIRDIESSLQKPLREIWAA